MKKFFNVTGFCDPERHYIIGSLRVLNDQIVKLIKDQYYFTIQASFQSGKTTMLHSLMHKLNGEGENISLVFSLESAGYLRVPVKDANIAIVDAIRTSAERFLQREYQPKHKSKDSVSAMKVFLSEWCIQLPKPLILLVDEINSLYDDVLISVLRQFRDGFQLLPINFPLPSLGNDLRKCRKTF